MRRTQIAVSVMLLLAVVLAIYLPSRHAAQPIVVELTPGPGQPKVSPAEAGIDEAGIQAAVAYAAARNTRALVIAHGGHIVFEKYWGDTSLDTPMELPQFDAALGALLVGTAMNDRLIPGIDLPLATFAPTLADTAAGELTLRELLAGRGEDRAGRESAELLARALQDATGQTWPQAIAESLWKPMGAGGFEFSAASAACCVRARLGDWMRIGQMLAGEGIFEGNQYTPPRYVRLMLTPTHKGSAAGLGVNLGGQFAARDVAWLGSAGSQRLWLVPSLRLTILRVGEAPPASLGWDESMIPDSIIRATQGWVPASAREAVDPAKFAPH